MEEKTCTLKKKAIILFNKRNEWMIFSRESSIHFLAAWKSVPKKRKYQIDRCRFLKITKKFQPLLRSRKVIFWVFLCKCGHLDFVGSNKGYLVALRHCKWLNHIFNGCTCFFALNFVNDLSIRGILHPIICKEFARHSFIKHEKSAASYVMYVNFVLWIWVFFKHCGLCLCYELR